MSLKALIAARRVPARLKWEPDLCIRRGRDCILVHILVSAGLPAYLDAAIAQLRQARFKRTHVLLLACDVTTEPADSDPPWHIRAPIVALKVAERAASVGCALAFERQDKVCLVFPASYQPPPLQSCKEETGHIPSWLCSALAGSSSFSAHLSKTLKSFAKRYEVATRRPSIPNDREADLVTDFAKSFARGDRRLFFPIGQLLVLREFEMSRASRARDHFFHTFNNLFLGFYILSGLFKNSQYIAEIDKFIAQNGKSKLYPWECLWFLTCMFHDPAYTAEKFWGNLRFAYGVPQDEAPDEEIPEPVRIKIKDMWDTKFVAARQDLSSLYRRAAKQWIPPSLRKSQPDSFDSAIQTAYFDGRYTSHSLVSGLRLIGLCMSHDVPSAGGYDPKTALIACEIAALAMMFHDQRCRAILAEKGLSPIAFEHLPYASLLMFVDALQDDRRDIRQSRFRKHEVLRQIKISGDAVEASVCLPEVPVKEWAPRIDEYESVMAWTNAKSQIKFRIDYRTDAGL